MIKGENKVPGVWVLVISVMVITTFLVLRNRSAILDSLTSTPGENYSLQQASCMQCHAQDQGFSAYHDPKSIGCEACHLGDPTALEKEGAHKNMVLIPGNLDNAELTCGKCHAEELEKIEASLMTTNSGLVAVDKFVFGETDSPDHHFDIRNIKNSPADTHLRNLCANCHLGASKESFGVIDQLSRGGGCNACHLNYSREAERGLSTYLASDKKTLPTHHPSSDIRVKDEHCFGCHSRSGRISTNYMGWQETLLEAEQVQGKLAFKIFQDKRVYASQPEDVHHASGMLCIDCHSSHEVMGDGNLHLHKEDAVQLRCDDCHYKQEPLTTRYDSLDRESLLVFMHREYSHQDKLMLKVGKDGHPLVNTFVDTGRAFLIGKGDGRIREISKQGEECSRDGVHGDLSCSSCHSQWVPRCIGCHNSFKKDDPMGYDLLNRQSAPGAWVEHVYEFSAGYPSLGVREERGKRSIEPAVPGMVMSIDRGSFEGEEGKDVDFHRLYAPASPHTTGKARSCRSCHNDPLTIGYGSGELRYLPSGKSGSWEFEPAYENNAGDGLPEDAWIPFLGQAYRSPASTRSNFRPLILEEQERILMVGACLECHDHNSSLMRSSLQDGLQVLLKNASESCAMPNFERN